jgi:hypothetical protein
MVARPAQTLALGLILALAALLRFTGLGWGLRHPPHTDEQDFLMFVVPMLEAGDFDHRRYEYPGLFLYLLGAAVAPLGRARWGGPEAYLAARAVSAAFGVLNVWLIWLAGVRRVGPAAALAAALWLAVSPLDIETSHQVRAESALQTAGILALLAWPGVGRDKRGDVRAGLVLGFASALKYTGVLILPSYLATRLLAPGRRFRGMVIAGLVALGVALACTPYAVLHFRQFFGIGLEGPAMRYTAGGGPRMYYSAGVIQPLQTLLFLVGGVIRTLGPLAAVLFVAGAALRLRSSWREWVPPLLHPVATLLVMAPTGMMFQRHILPAMGVVYLLAAAPVQSLATHSRVLAALLALAAASFPLRISASYARIASAPSAEDRALDWIQANVPAGSRILETRPGSAVGGNPGMALGIDRKRFEFLELTSDENRVALRWLAPEMDLVVAGPGKGGPWRSGLRTVYQAVGPLGAVRIQLQVPDAGSRPLYRIVDLRRAQLRASENPDGLRWLVDSDSATHWTSDGAMSGDEWIEVAFERPLRIGRIELLLGNTPSGTGPDLQIQAGEDGRVFKGLAVVEARDRPARQDPKWRPVSQVLVFEPRLARVIRILQGGVRKEPWSLSELRLSEVADSR